MGFFFGRRKSVGVPRDAAFHITQEGRDKLQDFSGDPRSRILVALETQGTSDVAEIAQYSGLSKGQVEKAIPSLVRKHLVQYANVPSSDMEGEA